MDCQWTVVATRPKCEQKAAYFLRMFGFEVYAPIARQRCRIRGGRRAFRTSALYPGYLFMAMVDGQWHAAVYAPGVRKVLKSGGGGPVVVPPKLLDKIRTPG